MKSRFAVTSLFFWLCVAHAEAKNIIRVAAPLTLAEAEKIQDCKDPWGDQLPAGQSIVAYKLPMVSGEQSCESENRTCKFVGGSSVLSGSFENKACQVDVPSIESMSAPSTVFTQVPFDINWSGSGFNSLSLSSPSSHLAGLSNGVSVLGRNSHSVIPAQEGSHTYDLKAENTAGVTVTRSAVVNAVNAPHINSLSFASPYVTVGKNALLSWSHSGSGALSIDNAIGSVTGSSRNITASGSPRLATYTLTTTRTLNGVTKSDSKSATIEIVAAPTLTINQYPSSTFVNSEFTLGWSGSGISSSSVRSSNANSGIPTSDIVLGNLQDAKITPTATGSFTYTVTGYNLAGDFAIKSQAISVVALPSVNTFTVPAKTYRNLYMTVSWSASNHDALEIDHGVGVVTGTSKDFPSPSTPGFHNITLTAKRTLGGVTKTSTMTKTVEVLPGPLYVAEENYNQNFTLTETVRVYYGTYETGRHWNKILAPGNHTCSNTYFGGDPDYGVRKKCWILD
jgi:hypothetical protein